MTIKKILILFSLALLFLSYSFAEDWGTLAEESGENFNSRIDKIKKLKKECKTNPDSDACNEVKKFKQERKKMREFCKNNKEDERCKKLKQRREKMKEFCKSNPDNKKCQKMKKRHEKRKRKRNKSK